MEKPGRKPINRSSYKRRRPRAELKILDALRKKQPQTIDELLESANIPRSTWYSVRDLMLGYNFIKPFGEDAFALWYFEDIEKIVEDAILQFINEETEFTVDELTSKVGKPWQDIEKVTYTLIRKNGLIKRTTEKGETYIKKVETGRLLYPV